MNVRLIVSFVVAVVLITTAFYISGVAYEVLRSRVPQFISCFEPPFYEEDEVFLFTMTPFVKPTIAASPYVIDVEKLVGATPDEADRSLKSMISTQLLTDCRFSKDNDDGSCCVTIVCYEIAKGDIPTVDAERIQSRTYSIENGRITPDGETPYITLHFRERLPLKVDAVIVRFRENVSEMDALRRVGYDVDTGAKSDSRSGRFFLTDYYAHQVMVQDDESGTGVAVYLYRLFH